MVGSALSAIWSPEDIYWSTHNFVCSIHSNVEEYSRNSLRISVRSHSFDFSPYSRHFQTRSKHKLLVSTLPPYRLKNEHPCNRQLCKTCAAWFKFYSQLYTVLVNNCVLSHFEDFWGAILLLFIHSGNFGCDCL